jgi:hypothetical protein
MDYKMMEHIDSVLTQKKRKDHIQKEADIGPTVITTKKREETQGLWQWVIEILITALVASFILYGMLVITAYCLS